MGKAGIWMTSASFTFASEVGADIVNGSPKRDAETWRPVAPHAAIRSSPFEAAAQTGFMLILSLTFSSGT